MASTRARELRRNLTDAERRLWWKLRYRKVGGYRFRRQVPIGPYIVDFACLSQRLLIELDGSQHGGNFAYDQARTRWLESRGYRVLRFWNGDVLQDIEGVLEAIHRALLETPHPNPPPQGGRELAR
jgi:very-short-patch-repair endonuclease